MHFFEIYRHIHSAKPPTAKGCKAAAESPALTGTPTVNGEKIATATPTVWHTPVYSGGWAEFNEVDGLGYGADGAGGGILDGLVRAPATEPGVGLVLTLPVGYRPNKQMWVSGTTTSGALRLFRLTSSGGLYPWGALAAANEGIAITSCSFSTNRTLNGPIAYGEPVRIAAARMSRAAIPEEPIDKCFCVVDADGAYRELVLVTITRDVDGAIYTPHYYSLKEGERFVDTQYPTKRPHAGADGYILPRWDFDAQVWTEAATAEEIAAWDDEHPAPPTPPPTEAELLREKVKLLEAGQTAISDRQDFDEDCIAEMAGQIYSV